MTDTIEIAGVKINRISRENAAKEIENFILSGQRHQVCVTNVYSVVLMQKDKEFRKINNESSLVVPDGMPLVWVSKLYGQSIPERVSGSDIFYQLCKIADEKKYKFFLLGSTNKVLNSMCGNLKKQFPNLQISDVYSPPYENNFSKTQNFEMIERINKVKPDILWVGMTAPKQEKWIYNNLDKLNVKVAIGVGAVFNFVSGEVRRAPLWMQRVGLEWLWRIIQEPRRLWKRYLIGNTIFICLIIKEFFGKLLSPKHNNLLF
jgi:N-acetylglucosaminyldiphosphoundecaprenol N-acetyl-beta-D-mannosaminyltransferase